MTSIPRLFLPLVGLALTLLLSACRPAASGPMPPPPPPQVTVGQVEERMLTDEEDLSGRVEAVESVEIRPRVSGYLTEVRFTAGSLVKKGDILFLIDPRPFEAAAQRAQADLDQARIRHEWARRDSDRATAMLADKAVSKEEADLRQTRVAEAGATLSGAEAAVALANINLEYTRIRSPIDGRVSRAMVTPGNNISGVDGFNTLLTLVVSVDPVHVYSDISEGTFRRLQALRRGSSERVPVRMGLADDEGFSHEGWVESLDNRLDPGTGSILLRTEFPNPDGLLTPGLFARVRIPTTARRPVLLVDEGAIGTDLSQKFVLTLSSSNTAVYRPVKLGGKSDGKRVVRQGLSAGEKVLVNGLQRVRPGSPVTPADKPTAAAQP